MKSIEIQERKNCDKKIFLDWAKCTILPNTTLNCGVAVLGHSIVTKSLPSWKIFYGNPIKFLKNRKKILLKLQNNIKNT